MLSDIRYQFRNLLATKKNTVHTAYRFSSNQYGMYVTLSVYLSFHFGTCFYTYILALSITLSAFWCSHFRTQMFLCPRMLCNESSLKIMRFKLFTTNGRKKHVDRKKARSTYSNNPSSLWTTWIQGIYTHRIILAMAASRIFPIESRSLAFDSQI